jgi:GT2 family glycosyltransferase
MLSIIIPANNLVKKVNPKYFYKKRFSLDDTIQSIKKNIDVEHEIILVINDYSNKELVDYAVNNRSITKFCINSSNAGVARSWNIGAHLAEGDYLCFCNDDVEFSMPGAFSTLINVLKKDPKIGQTGPQGGKWHLDQSGERTGIEKIDEADEISGYFFIIPAKVYHEAGGFDNSYTPAGVEEIDMSFKIRDLGYKCIVVPQTGIIHHGTHGISAKRSIVKYFDKEIDTYDLDKRNKQYFIKKWYQGN